MGPPETSTCWIHFKHDGPDFHVNTGTGECITTEEILRRREIHNQIRNNERQQHAQWEREDKEYYRQLQFEHKMKTRLLVSEINQRYPVGSTVTLFHTKGKDPKNLIIYSPAKILDRRIFLHGEVDLGEVAIFVKPNGLYKDEVLGRRIFVSDIDEFGVIEYE